MMRGNDIALWIGPPLAILFGVAILFGAIVGGLSTFGVLSSQKTEPPPERLFKIQECEIWGFTYRGEPQTVAICPTFQPHYPRGEK